jgi:hypothetical protein
MFFENKGSHSTKKIPPAKSVRKANLTKIFFYFISKSRLLSRGQTRSYGSVLDAPYHNILGRGLFLVENWIFMDFGFA